MEKTGFVIFISLSCVYSPLKISSSRSFHRWISNRNFEGKVKNRIFLSKLLCRNSKSYCIKK